jgi:hypothetical protein
MSIARRGRRPAEYKLFTIVLDHRGGTYIAQVRAVSPASALTAWAHQLPFQDVPGIGEATAAALDERLRREPPMALDGLASVWCTGSVVRGAYALINIILTGRATTPPNKPLKQTAARRRHVSTPPSNR